MKNYYEILGIKEDADKAQIKKSYIMLAKKYHPDKVQHSDSASNDIFADIAEAYDVLYDEEKGKEYDDNLKKFKNGIDVENQKRDEKLELMIKRAKRRVSERNFEDALKYFDKLIEHFKYISKKPSSEMLSLYGYSLFFSGRNKTEGLAVMDRCVTETMFNDQDIILNLVEAYIEEKRVDKARELFKQAAGINPRSRRLMRINAMMKQNKKSIFDIIFRRG